MPRPKFPAFDDHRLAEWLAMQYDDGAEKYAALEFCMTHDLDTVADVAKGLKVSRHSAKRYIQRWREEQGTELTK